MDTPTPNGADNQTPEARAARRSRPAALQSRWVLPVLLLVVLVVIMLGVRWYAYSRIHVSTDDAQVDADIYSVSARIPGHLTGLYVTENQTVRKGDLLAEIDPRDYQVASEQARAALAQAQSAAQAAQGNVSVTQQTGGAGISQAEAGVAAAQAQIDASQRAAQAAAAATQMAQRDVNTQRAAVASAQATADEAKREAVRNRNLEARGAVSGQQADQAQAAADAAQANLEAARAKLSSNQAAVTQAQARQSQAEAAVGQAQAALGQARAAVQSSQASPAQVGVRRQEAKGAEAQVEAAKARLAQAELNLSYTRITAPVDGVVAKKNAEAGQYVQPGQPLFAIVPTGGQYVTANYKETQVGKIKPGEQATFTVDAYPGVTFTGRVASVSPGTGSVFSLLPPENATGNFTKVVQRVPVRISIDPQSAARRPLRAGMNVVATIDTGSK